MSLGSNINRCAIAPLRQWTEGESEEARQTLGRGEVMDNQVFLRKIVVACGIAELLRQSARSGCNSGLPWESLGDQCSIDNFVVRAKAAVRGSRPSWKDIEGVDMLSPRLSVNIIQPSFLQDEYDCDQDDEMGGYFEVEFPSLPDADDAAVFVDQDEEDHRCHSFGVLLCELFSDYLFISSDHARDYEGGSVSANKKNDASREPACKKIKSIKLSRGTVGDAHYGRKSSELQRRTLSEECFPSSLSLVIQNLLDCLEDDRPYNAYESLEAVINDLHLLLLDPRRFLFTHEPAFDNNGRIKLPFQEHRLYGRENEVALITEAFCRVSSGRSESLFIGGFSGSGKSRLVNGLTARVDAVGGYVLTHKFDQMSQERSMLDIVAMFNDLCLLIRDKHSQPDLLVLLSDLVQVFGSDMFVLFRLLPNFRILSSLLNLSAHQQERDIQINVRSISFTLQRFLRVVSSTTHPVVLFFDDLQWCDESALNVVESLLCDAIGSACLFFVGTYRSNEVADDHEIFRLAQRLRSFGMPTTMLSLEGLNPRDLNIMVSDALCTFPRISESLSDIIYQKTKGNPFFVLSFMRSLVDRGLLEFSINLRRWVWDEDEVSSMDITGNVLHLLSTKMNGLSSNLQSVLKVAACFGIKIEKSVVETLTTDPEHSDIRDKLNEVVNKGFMVKCGTTSNFKFVHDKVREAAYSLIPDTDKDQYHYKLGMSLYLMTKLKGDVADNVLFTIADQFKHGRGNLVDENPELGIEFAEFYELAGTKAVACSDHATSCSYLTSALSLLPPDHWKSHYDLSLRLSITLAKSCYSCGDVEKAQSILQGMTRQCHSIEDKLPAHALLAEILISSNMFSDAYILCYDVLSQLGEEIPESLQPVQIGEIVQVTLKLVEKMSSQDLLEMKEMDERLSISMNFYSIMATAAYFGKPEMLPFIASRTVQLTMKYGLCKHSMVGLVQFALVLGSTKTSKVGVDIASRIGKAAISCSKERYHASEQLPNLYVVYYGIIAPRAEPLQTCAEMLRQGFDAGMSLGEPGIAFFNSVHHIRTAIIAGERLPALLEKADYYLKMANAYKNEVVKAFLSLYRDTITILTNNGKTVSSMHHSNDLPANNTNAKVLESVYFQRAIQAYWQGYSKRCQFYIEKFLNHVTFNFSRHHFITFIHGLNSFELQKSQSTIKLRSITNRSVNALKTAASRASMNFQNKVHLLEAERFSLENENSEAEESYAASINSARLSGFIHEEGLACELAGRHYKKNGHCSIARRFFDQAKQCYEEWGSRMKVDYVTRELSFLSDHAPGPGGPSFSISS